MTQFLNDSVRNAMLSALAATVGSSAKIQFWSGPVPADESAATTGAVKAALGSLPSTPYSAPSGGVMSKAGTWTVTGLPAAGTGVDVTFARITNSAETVAYHQFSLGDVGSGADAILDNANIANNQITTVTQHDMTAPH